MTVDKLEAWLKRQGPPSFKSHPVEDAALDAAAGRCVLWCRPPATRCNPGGHVQGGFLAAMLDDAMSFAAIAMSNCTHVYTTLEMQTSYLAPVPLGLLRVEGEVVHMGRSTVFLKGRLYTEAGELAVSATSTNRARPFPGGNAGATGEG